MRLIDANALAKSLSMEANEYRNHGDYARAEGIGNALWAIAHAPTVGGWISVKDRLPENGKHVLATCEVRSLYGYKKRYVCEAFYAAKHSIKEGKYPEETDCYDYDEEEDEYYLQEGWYEVIHNWDEYSSIVIDDFVTHWMPLPEPPKEEKPDD